MDQAFLWKRPIKDGRSYTDAAIALWLKCHGKAPHWRPQPRYSQPYCGWLDRPENRRGRDFYDAMVRQQWKCWVCGWGIGSLKGIDMHHPLGYDNLGNEDPSELVAVHRRRCHRQAHDTIRQEQEHEQHWRKAA